MNNLQWIKLKRDFEAARCILMIGPKLAAIEKQGDWLPLIEELSLYLADFIEQEGIEFDQNARHNLPYIALKFLGIKGARRVDLEDLTKDFYQQNTQSIPEAYKLLASLPAHLIINTNPDDFMEKALREQGKQCHSLYYNFRRDTGVGIDIDQISTEKPLVYNLFGSLEESESLVLTEEDQLEFIRNIVKDDPRIPEEILGQFDHRKTYLFFGFNLENWQFRLLLDGLKLREENTTLSPREPRFPISSTTRSFYEDRFNFQFIDSEIDAFLKELAAKVSPGASQNEPVRTQTVFLLFDEKDDEFRQQLEDNLSQMQSNQEIEIWYPQKFTAGTDASEVLEKFRNSDYILPIISPNFLADPALMEQKLPEAERLHREGKTKVFPLIARPCDWLGNPFFKKLDPLPENMEPVTSSHWNTRDDAFFNIVQTFKKRIK